MSDNQIDQDLTQTWTIPTGRARRRRGASAARCAARRRPGDARRPTTGTGKRRRRIRRFPHLYQIDEMDCGASSLAIICRYFGKAISLARIRQLVHTGVDGASLKAICEGANELGPRRPRGEGVDRPASTSCRSRRSSTGTATTGWCCTTWTTAT